MKILTILISFLLVFISATGFAADVVNRAQFTTLISGRQPVDNVQALDTSYDTLYFFTDIRDCAGCRVTHRWYLDGNHQFDLYRISGGEVFRYWSKVETNGLTGVWTVEVLINDESVVTKNLTYTKASRQRPETTQQQLQNQLNTECEDNLQYFSEQSSKNPDDPYFKFMLNKWGRRCYGE